MQADRLHAEDEAVAEVAKTLAINEHKSSGRRLRFALSKLETHDDYFAKGDRNDLREIADNEFENRRLLPDCLS